MPPPRLPQTVRSWFIEIIVCPKIKGLFLVLLFLFFSSHLFSLVLHLHCKLFEETIFLFVCLFCSVFFSALHNGVFHQCVGLTGALTALLLSLGIGRYTGKYSSLGFLIIYIFFQIILFALITVTSVYQ